MATTFKNEKGRDSGKSATPTTSTHHSALLDATYRELFGASAHTWFDATAIAARFDKHPTDWLADPWTAKYLIALADTLDIGTDELLHSTSSGIRMHTNLAVAFSRWLDPRFDFWFEEVLTCGGTA